MAALFAFIVFLFALVPCVFACDVINGDKLVFGFPVVGGHWVVELAECRADVSYLSLLLISNGAIDRISTGGEDILGFVGVILIVNA